MQREVMWVPWDEPGLEHLRLTVGESRLDADSLVAGLDATPFTNTPPIRRLDWQRGATARLAAAYVALPSMRLTVEQQLYTCLEELAAGGRFRFELPASGFAVDLPVDRDGLVLDYPGLFRRVWTG